MYVVGTDGVTVTVTGLAPQGVRHAVTADGRALCRDRGVVYTFPALAWDAEAGCDACVRVRAELAAVPEQPVDPYPAEAPALLAATSVPAVIAWQSDVPDGYPV